MRRMDGSTMQMRPASRVDASTVLLRPLPGDLTQVDPWGHRISKMAEEGSEHPSRWYRVAPSLLPALVAVLMGGLGVTGPGLWTDELATWGMTVTAWQQMWPLLRWVDAVLAPYYMLMRLWSELVGSSDLALRVPSVLAMMGAAAMVGALGARLAGPRVGLLAGVLFAALPSTTRFAQEARPYALTAFAATLATYLLVRALDRPTWLRFAGYAAAVLALGLLHVVALLLLLGHGWIILAWRRRLAIEWSIWATAGVLPLLPLLWLGSSQRNQVAHIRDVGFDSTPFYLTTVFGSVAIGTLLLLLAMFSLPLRYPASIYLAWAALPVVALLLVSLVVPLFLPRYLLFTLPAWALLAGTALARLRFPWAIGALVLIAALGVSAHVALRQADGHDEATREAAAVISEQTKPGDGVVYADSEFRGGWTPRDTVAHYVPAEHRPKDLLLTRPPRTDGKLLAGECDDIGRCLGDTQRVWVFRLGEHTDPLRGIGPKKEEALRNGYRVEQTWHRTNVTLALLVRDPTGR